MRTGKLFLFVVRVVLTACCCCCAVVAVIVVVAVVALSRFSHAAKQMIHNLIFLLLTVQNRESASQQKQGTMFQCTFL